MGKTTRLTNEEFIRRAKLIYGDKYDYSKVKYSNMYEKICIICPIHGEFFMTPNAHIIGKQNCPKCSNHYHYTINEWVNRFNEIHNGKYDYSLLFNNGFDGDKFDAICPEHGVFKTSKHKHLIGQGCPECGKEKTKKANTNTTEQFIKKAKLIHGNKYCYSKVKYTNAHTKVCIICPEHGEFWQKPSVHLNGCGCPICKESKLENDISRYMINKAINFEYRKTFNWLGKQHLDFFIPDKKIAIECQGKQHFVGWAQKKEELLKQINADQKKYELCKKHNIKLCYFAKKEDIKNVSYIYENNVFTSKKHLFKMMEN